MWRFGNTSETFQPHRVESGTTPRFGHTILGSNDSQKLLRFLVFMVQRSRGG
jgi:hypothetical protein